MVIVYILVYINGRLAPWTGWESSFVGENVFQYNSGGDGYLAIGDTYQCYKNKLYS